MTDRTYWHLPGARSWHSLNDVVLKPGITLSRPDGMGARFFTAICGRNATDARTRIVERADRIPSDAHLCGNCARVIAARTDVEGAAESSRRRDKQAGPNIAADSGSDYGNFEGAPV